ncbi:hypothetical protein BDN67DRAFT_985527 [Paxillus ammoniavirescens]|nr:hypothetical protein BDN67DRAFT_985527 [Paxillus ammoniavirescens]
MATDLSSLTQIADLEPVFTHAADVELDPSDVPLGVILPQIVAGSSSVPFGYVPDETSELVVQNESEDYDREVDVLMGSGLSGAGDKGNMGGASISIQQILSTRSFGTTSVNILIVLLISVTVTQNSFHSTEPVTCDKPISVTLQYEKMKVQKTY